MFWVVCLNFLTVFWNPSIGSCESSRAQELCYLSRCLYNDGGIFGSRTLFGETIDKSLKEINKELISIKNVRESVSVLNFVCKTPSSYSTCKSYLQFMSPQECDTQIQSFSVTSTDGLATQARMRAMRKRSSISVRIIILRNTFKTIKLD